MSELARLVTRDHRRAYRLPDRVHFAPLVPVFTGLLARGSGLESPAAVRLYRDVFSTALNDLPRQITRLVVVPDGPLQHLPFDALRAEEGRPPLANQYDLVLAPSATLWLNWRAHPPAPSKQRALALADPEILAGVNRNASDRGVFLTETLALGRLPHARTESRSMARRLSGVDRLVGAEHPSASSRLATFANTTSCISPRTRSPTSRSPSGRRCFWHQATRAKTGCCRRAKSPT